jgi:hypothetical protein
MNFIIYNNIGEILRTGSCPEEMFLIQAQDGETVIEGVANDFTQYIADGVVTDYTEAELAAKSSIPYGYKWQMPERALVQDLTTEQINIYLAEQARLKRDTLLSACDWTQTGDQIEARKLLWQPYRQALRDITLQTGFPTIINWPTLP